MAETARRKKVCADPKCQEEWSKLSEEAANSAIEFTFCPFCAEELTTHCSACEEPISDQDFKFCPWCGREFEK